MNAGKQKILFCSILYAMILHEDELISLNTPENLLKILLQIVIGTRLAQWRWVIGGGGEGRMCWVLNLSSQSDFCFLFFCFLLSASEENADIKPLSLADLRGLWSFAHWLTSDYTEAPLSVLRTLERGGEEIPKRMDL